MEESIKLFDTNYPWIENNHLEELDNYVRIIYPFLIRGCDCESCTQDRNERLELLTDYENFRPAYNNADALFLLNHLNFACFTIERDWDFYIVKISVHRDGTPDEKEICKSYPSLSEAICLALIALYQKEFVDIK